MLLLFVPCKRIITVLARGHINKAKLVSTGAVVAVVSPDMVSLAIDLNKSDKLDRPIRIQLVF